MNLEIFRGINVLVVQLKEYLLQNYKTGEVITWINEIQNQYLHYI